MFWLPCIGPHVDFQKEFADLLLDILANIDKALIVGDFNIHIERQIMCKDLFTDIINSLGVKQSVTGPSHCFNHKPDFILKIYLTDTDILTQSDVIDHNLGAKWLISAICSVLDRSYLQSRPIIPTTKDLVPTAQYTYKCT